MPKLKNRRGVTLVLTAFMLTVLIGAAAFAVDFGRMYMYRTQLSAAADAAALAGIWQVLHKEPLPDSAVNQAKYYASRHLVGTDTVTLDDGDITPGSWPIPSGPFTQLDWTNPGVNAIRVVTRTRTAATQNYTFGRVLGLTSHTVLDTAIAVWAYVGKTSCIRPVALPYQALLDQLTKDDGVVRDAATYTLTDADVIALRNAGLADTVQLRVTDEGGSPVNGNFYGIQLGPYQYADGTLGNPNTGMANFDTDLGGPCSGESYQGDVGPGDWLAPENGEGGTNIPRGIGQLCNVTIQGNSTTLCPAPYPEIKVVLWSPNPITPAGCSNCFYAKVIGVFAVTGYVSVPGHTSPDGVKGYFTSLPSSGSFTNVPTPITKTGLVK